MQWTQSKIAIFSIIAVATIGSLVYLSFVSFPTNENLEPQVSINIVAKQFEYDPTNITVQFGSIVELMLTSIDVVHGFRLEEFGINNIQILPGEKTIVKFTANQRGTFIFYCDVFCGVGHSDHFGYLTVV